jgi:hypothetical protein
MHSIRQKKMSDVVAKTRKWGGERRGNEQKIEIDSIRFDSIDSSENRSHQFTLQKLYNVSKPHKQNRHLSGIGKPELAVNNIFINEL